MKRNCRFFVSGNGIFLAGESPCCRKIRKLLEVVQFYSIDVRTFVRLCVANAFSKTSGMSNARSLHFYRVMSCAGSSFCVWVCNSTIDPRTECTGFYVMRASE